MNCEISEYGAEILASPEFRKTFETRHHINSTVGAHTMRVVEESLRICNKLAEKGFKVDKKRLVLSGLCHDLAMVGTRQRYGKFLGKFTTAFRHPVDSARIACGITEIHKRTGQAISRHMWPLCILPPTSLEGWILTLADKKVAVRELLYMY